YGSSIPLTASGLPVDATGTVAFSGAGSTWCDSEVVDGEARCTIVAAVNAGDHAFTAAYSGDALYEPAAATTTARVSQASQTVSFTSAAPNDAAVGGSYTPVVKDGGSGNPVAITVDGGSSEICEIDGGTVHFITVGECTIIFRKAASANWQAADPISQTFAIGMVPAFAEFPDIAFVPGTTSSFRITAEGSPSPTIAIADDAAADALPSGITFASGDEGSATLAGMSMSPGDYTLPIVATSPLGEVTATLEFTVAAIPEVPLPEELPAGSGEPGSEDDEPGAGAG